MKAYTNGFSGEQVTQTEWNTNIKHFSQPTKEMNLALGFDETLDDDEKLYFVGGFQFIDGMWIAETNNGEYYTIVERDEILTETLSEAVSFLWNELYGDQ